MASDGLLRRTKSLLWGKDPRDGQKAEDEPLPYRPVKLQYRQIHVVSDDIALHQNSSSTLPRRTRPHRNTWPTDTEKSRPGAHAFDQVPTLIRTPWELERKRRPQSQYSRHIQNAPVLPARVFENLPTEIYHCILNELEALHTQSHFLDVSGLVQDLRSLNLVSKRWRYPAREHLYRELWLPEDVPTTKRKFSMSRSQSRHEMLIRTLKNDAQLSTTVRCIRFPPESQLRNQVSRDWHMRQVTQVVELCAQVEHIYGLAVASERYAKYCRLLAARPGLRSHAWVIDHQGWPSLGFGDLLDLHAKWTRLRTLVLRKKWPMNLSPGLVTALIHRLPALQHLMLEGFSKDEFHNGSLLSIRPLKSLRLEDMEGITDQGVQQLAESRSGYALESLSLIGLELNSLRTICNVLAHLGNLRKFKLVQDNCPAIPAGMEAIASKLMMSSSSLQYLHWDTIIPGSALSTFARSIEDRHFPQLRKIKAPSDLDGTLQALCKPMALQTLTPDDLHFLETRDSDRYERSLRLAQLQAQLRMRESRQQPSFSVVVEDRDEHVQHTHLIGGYLGSVSSRIEYTLEPDIEGDEEALASFSSLVHQTVRRRAGLRKLVPVLDYDVLF